MTSRSSRSQWVSPRRVGADFLRALVESGVLLVVSTDLSHYHPHETAMRLDRRTAAAISARDANAIAPTDVCGVFALRGAVEWSRRADLAVRLLDLRTSADTVGDASRVVGYGASQSNRTVRRGPVQLLFGDSTPTTDGDDWASGKSAKN